MTFKILEKIALGDIIDKARGLSSQYLDPSFPSSMEWARLNKIDTPKEYLKKKASGVTRLQLDRLIIGASQGKFGYTKMLKNMGRNGGIATGQKKTALKYLEQEKNNEHFGHRDYQHIMFGDDVERGF